MKNHLHRIIVKGGVLSLGDFKEIIKRAKALELNALSFGSRQDIILPQELSLESDAVFGSLSVVKPADKEQENIVSSYVSADIFPGTLWLTANKYLYVLESFRYQPKLKINITDPKQRLVPLFTGNLNFIASSEEDYWFLYIKLPEWKEMQLYPVLVYSWDVAPIAQFIEQLLIEEPDSTEMLFELVNEKISDNNRNISQPLLIPFHPFPYYEGMNKVGDEYWLGLYWRNNLYDLDFLEAMCDLCADCKIGKISITPWKSFVVKGIPVAEKLRWEKFLGKFGINVRHSLLELNWHVPVNNPDALSVKTFLVRSLDQNDISTYGLTFSVVDFNSEKAYFTSIVIEKNPIPQTHPSIIVRDTFNVLYAKNFDPNSQKYQVHVQDVDKVELPGVLMELSKKYFEELGSYTEKTKKTTKPKEVLTVIRFQCKHCLTVYNEELGDEAQNILPATAFEEIPTTYTCSVCDAPKSDFVPKEFTTESH
jgi:rubredoxin